MFLQFITVLDPDGVLVVDVPVVLFDVGGDHGQFLQQLIVDAGVFATFLGPLVQIFELHLQSRCLQGIQPAVVAHDGVEVLGLAAVNSQDAHLFCQVRVVCDHHAAVTQGAQVLAGEEAEASQVAYVARFASAILRSNGLSGVLHHLQVVLLGQGQDGIHPGALAEQMDRHDDLGARRDLLADEIRVDVVSLGIDVHEDGDTSQPGDHSRRGEEGVGSGDHLIAVADPAGSQGEEQSVRTRGNPHGIFCFRIGSHRLLEILYVGAEDKAAAFHDLVHRCPELVFDGCVLGFQIQQRNIHRLLRFSGAWGKFIVFDSISTILAAVRPSQNLGFRGLTG